MPYASYEACGILYEMGRVMAVSEKGIEVITPLAHKGGVGKSLTLRLLYQGIARVLRQNGETRKILVVDADPQGNTSSRWLAMTSETQGYLRGKLPPVHPDLDLNERSDLSDIWLQGVAPEPYQTANPLIDIVPARESMLYEATGPQSYKFQINGIRAWLEDNAISERYCAVFIDTPPSKGLLTQAALAAATACYIPVEYEPYPIDGMDQMFHMVDSEMISRPDNHRLSFQGIIANKVPVTRATIYHRYRDGLRNHKTYGPHMLECELRDLAAFTETDAKTTIPGDIFDYPSKTHMHVLNEAQHFCHAIFSQLNAFDDWDLDFRQGESFDQPESKEGRA